MQPGGRTYEDLDIVAIVLIALLGVFYRSPEYRTQGPKAAWLYINPNVQWSNHKKVLLKEVRAVS